MELLLYSGALSQTDDKRESLFEQRAAMNRALIAHGESFTIGTPDDEITRLCADVDDLLLAWDESEFQELIDESFPTF